MTEALQSGGDAPVDASQQAAPGAGQTAAPQAAPQESLLQGQEGAQQQQAEGAQTSEGDKPEDGSTEGDKGEKPAEEKPVGAPEKYEFKNADGTAMEATPILEAFSEVAKELNMPQDAAQKLMDKVAPVIAQQQQDQFTKLVNGWVDAVKVDKEYGGDKFAENLAMANKALDAFGSPELKQLLRTSGFGNHPEMIRAFYRAGKAISQDTTVPGGTSPKGEAPKDAASVLYGKSA